MKKFILKILFCIVLVLSMGVVAYAAGTSFDVRYLPGTNDTVMNMPTNGSGAGGEVYTVSGAVPKREGYEFLGWTLDYSLAKTYTINYQVSGDPNCGKPGDVTEPATVSGIRAGSNITLASGLSSAWQTKDGSALPNTATYTVNYFENGKDTPFYNDVISGKSVGDTVSVEAMDVEGYKLTGSNQQNIEIKPNIVGTWTFTGWCSDRECTTPITKITNITSDITVYGKWVYSETKNTNEVSFFFDKLYKYYVYYIDILGKQVADMKIKYALPNECVYEPAVPVDGYMAPAMAMEQITEDGFKVNVSPYLPLQ